MNANESDLKVLAIHAEHSAEFARTLIDFLRSLEEGEHFLLVVADGTKHHGFPLQAPKRAVTSALAEHVSVTP